MKTLNNKSICRRWLSLRNASRGLPVKSVELHGMQVNIINMINIINIVIVQNHWGVRRETNDIWGCRCLGIPHTHLPSTIFKSNTKLSFFKTFFSFSGLDQNLVTAASYMVPTKYTKYAKQVGDITLSSYDDIRWCTSWLYYKAQK